jgi:hypothetical protein
MECVSILVLTEPRKNHLVLCAHLLVIFLLPKSLIFSCNIALNLFYILKEQSSEEDLLPSSHY